MPNIQIEYSSNLDETVKKARLVEIIHQAAIDTREFPTWGIRTFANSAKQSRVADGDAETGFIQIIVRITPGRDLETRQRIARGLFDAISVHLQPFLDVRRMGYQLEVQEFDADVTLSATSLKQKV